MHSETYSEVLCSVLGMVELARKPLVISYRRHTVVQHGSDWPAVARRDPLAVPGCTACPVQNLPTRWIMTMQNQDMKEAPVAKETCQQNSETCLCQFRGSKNSPKATRISCRLARMRIYFISLLGFRSRTTPRALFAKCRMDSAYTSAVSCDIVGNLRNTCHKSLPAYFYSSCEALIVRDSEELPCSNK